MESLPMTNEASTFVRLISKELLATGELCFSDNDGVSLRLFSFDGPIRIKDSSTLHLLTEHGAIATISNTIPTFATQTPEQKKFYPNGIFRLEAVASSLFLGPETWDEKEDVAEATFRLPEIEPTLINSPLRKRLRSAKDTCYRDLEIFSLKTDDVQLSLGYQPTWTLGSEEPSSIETQFHLKFLTPHKSDDARMVMRKVSNFFAFSTCSIANPAAIRMVTFKGLREQKEAGLDFKIFHEAHSLHQIPSSGPSISWQDSVFLASNEEEVTWMRDSLQDWLSRDDEWQSAAALMNEALALRGQLSADPVLAAARWFERLPPHQEERIVSEASLSRIAKSAAAKAEEIGESQSAERILGAIKKIGLESHKERCRRIVNHLLRETAAIKDEEKTVKALCTFRGTRGKAAHGPLVFCKKEGVEKVQKEVAAVEAICFLSILLSFRPQAAAIKRVRRNPILRSHSG